MGFNNQVRHVQKGSPVTAGNTSRATRDLEQQTRALREQLSQATLGQNLVLTAQPLDPDVLDGHVVYWNDDTQRYEQALAGVTNDSATGMLVPTAAADALAIVIAKQSATVGTLLLLGVATLTATQLTNLTGEAIPSPGRYYLSGMTPGTVVHQRPPVSVAVLYLLGPADACETGGAVFVLPQMRDFLEDHVHYKFELTAAPAGTHVPPDTGDVHVITDADSALPGWLPADHAIFDGNAPAGAKFGYNLSADTAVGNAWPPIPTENAVLELYTPDNTAAFPLAGRVLPEYVKFTRYGIWWMSDCEGEVPWAATLNTTVSSSLSVSSSAGECPTPTDMRLILSFVKMTFLTDKTVVTSLQGATDHPIEFVNCNGEPATTGDLYAQLILQALYGPNEAYGGQVLKEIIDGKLSFGRGWVAEGLISNSDELTITSTHSRALDPTLPVSGSNPRVHQGITTLTLQLDPIDRELNPQIVRLSDVLESEFRGMDYLGFPEDRDSSVRMRYDIPSVGLPLAAKFKVRTQVFGLAAGVLPALTMTYRRITRPTENTPTPIVDSWTAMTYDVVTPSDDADGAGGDLAAGELIEVESDGIDIEAGETILVVLARAADAAPAFDAEVGVLLAKGIIYPDS